jgi:spore maturation protein CgeB
MSLGPKILYVGSLARGSTSRHRCLSLQRLCATVAGFDLNRYQPKSRTLNAVRTRLPVGPLIAKVNANLLQAAAKFRPDVIWFDKPIHFPTETVLALKSRGARLVCYNMDSPFGPRNDPGWLQFKRVYRLFDLHCLFRASDVERYEAWKLPWIKLQFSYDPSIHVLPPAPWSDADRTRGVSFIGSPYEERPAFLRSLAEEFNLPLSIAGPRWEGVYPDAFARKHLTSGPLMDEEYAEGIWRSRVNLAFISRLNEDDVALKAFEIAACGQFLLARRSEEHMALFAEDSEVAFFSSREECASKAQFYLDRPDLRQAFGVRLRERAVHSGYDNDTQLAKVLARLSGDI